MTTIGNFGKAIIATITATLLSVVAGLQTVDSTEGAGSLSTTELLVTVGVFVAGLIAVAAVKNAVSGAWAYAKAWLGSAAAFVSTLIPLSGDGFDTADLLLAVAAGVAAFTATAAISNAPRSVVAGAPVDDLPPAL